MENIEGIRKVMRRVAREEATRQIRQLYTDVMRTLATNPHNIFKGTPAEYIRKYGLASKLKRKVFDHFSV